MLEAVVLQTNGCFSWSMCTLSPGLLVALSRNYGFQIHLHTSQQGHVQVWPLSHPFPLPLSRFAGSKHPPPECGIMW